MQIKSLANTSLEAIVNCLQASFKGYFVQLPSSLKYWEDRFRTARVELNYSYGMFDSSQLVGFIIIGIDDFNGKSTAFNTGTGVLPGYRGKGIVDRLYEFAIPQFQEFGISSCRLEVITGNERAIKVYQRIGFNITRRLHCFKGVIDKGDGNSRLKKIAIESLPAGFYKDEDLYSWDHTLEGIKASGENYKTYAVLNTLEHHLGYFTINPDFGHVSRITKTENNSYGDVIRAIGKITKEIKINNLDETRVQLRKNLLQAGLVNVIDQFEMEMKIRKS